MTENNKLNQDPELCSCCFGFGYIREDELCGLCLGSGLKIKDDEQRRP
jgi:hypothetical protein